MSDCVDVASVLPFRSPSHSVFTHSSDPLIRDALLKYVLFRPAVRRLPRYLFPDVFDVVIRLSAGRSVVCCFCSFYVIADLREFHSHLGPPRVLSCRSSPCGSRVRSRLSPRLFSVRSRVFTFCCARPVLGDILQHAVAITAQE